MRKRRRGLGSSSKHHASRVAGRIASVERNAELSLTGSCSLRLTSLHAAVEGDGIIHAHAFESGGRVAKGALTSKTISTEMANRAYAAHDKVTEAVAAFRRDCIKKG
jgi:hypothetical protein